MTRLGRYAGALGMTLAALSAPYAARAQEPLQYVSDPQPRVERALGESFRAPTRLLERAIDPEGRGELLRSNEFFVPHQVLEAYQHAIDPYANGTPLGVYLGADNGARAELQERFSEELRERRFNEQEITTYIASFDKGDQIFLSDRLAGDSLFYDVLSHERLHELIDALPERDYTLLKGAAEDLLSRKYLPGDSVVALRDGMELSELQTVAEAGAIGPDIGWPLVADIGGGMCHNIARDKWKEFYPYFLNGYFKPRVGMVLERDHPEAFALYQRLESRARVQRDGNRLASKR